MLHRSAAAEPLDWRPPTGADLDDLDQLLTDIEDADQPGQRHRREELQSGFDDPQHVLIDHCRLVRDPAGRLLAYGWNHPFADDTDPRRVHVSGGVHPGHRGQGVGHALLSWQLDAARDWWARVRSEESGPLWAIAYVEGERVEQRALYEDLGLRPKRWYADMSTTLNGGLAAAEEPPGVRIVPLNRKRFEAVRLAHNEVFADHWGSQPVDAVSWEMQLLRPESRLSWSWVALEAETSEVVGYATNAAYQADWSEHGVSEGWTDRLGVRPRWRNRGVARALLTASLRSFAEAGLDAAGLGVDSDDPRQTVEPYQELGYRSTHTAVMYGRVIDDRSCPEAAGLGALER